MEHKYRTLSNSTCINPVLEKGEAVLRTSIPENTGQLYSFIETCGFSDEIYFKLSKHFRAALMTAQRRCCIGVQFTNRSSFAKMKIALTKEPCPLHYKQKASGCCNPCSPGRLNTTRRSLENQDGSFSAATGSPELCEGCRALQQARWDVHVFV